MSGNEYFDSLPHENTDPSRVIAGSPLAVVGLVLEALRERFRADAGLDFAWHPDPSKTGILIEAGYTGEAEARGYGRALYVTRTVSEPLPVVVASRGGVRLPDHKAGHYALMRVGMTVDCVSTVQGESAILGDLVQHFFIASRDIIARSYGLHEVSYATLGTTAPFTQAQERFSTPVNVDITLHIRWTTVKIAPILNQIGLRVYDAQTRQDATGAFVEAATASMSRVWPLVPPSGETIDNDTPTSEEEVAAAAIASNTPPVTAYTYTRMKQLLATDSLNWTTPDAVFRALLVGPAYVFDATELNVSDVLPYEISGGTYQRTSVLGRTVTLDLGNDRVLCDALDPTFNPLGSVATPISGMIIYKQIGGSDASPADDPLICYLRFTPPLIGDGSPLIVELDPTGAFTIGR